ncbi:MAG: cox cluster protein [Natronomonas sp.]
MDTESERMADRYDKTSPWPIVLVFGLVSSELGILFGLYPLAVGGLIAFVGSVSGIVHEAGYAASPWRLLSGLGAALAVLGALVVSTQTDVTTVGTLLSTTDVSPITLRGVTVTATGAILTVAGLVLSRIVNQ